MSVESVESAEVIEAVADKEPIYFAPRRVSLISDLSGIFSWVVLVGFIAYFAVEVIYLQAQMKTGGLILSDLIKEPSFLSYMFINLVAPLLTGLGLFFILQAVATGMNVLLELDYNTHDAFSKTKA
jgi:hypothetical protein